MTKRDHFSSVIIANPKGGGGKAKWMAPRLSQLVAEYIPDAEILWTSKPREVTLSSVSGGMAR